VFQSKHSSNLGWREYDFSLLVPHPKTIVIIKITKYFEAIMENR
jgi:hypothetical protein